ncbi:hypothetical protein Sta7437_1552 [Stanieria cyanosphaera PCC 7437]|uniref:DUF455 domain-containing protein n=1 Tax=Stanieria cyanosphaera (strain ATCC 29371 / PCC 7437) TaxID=111780 RepID=K9XST1_STAC7|nr:ferritin-like domain-containing protein [Stanieria cyanosphaera]AFZ35119.1 hypothetical protein Sta7437_1552 [Stanieria cyanosphaera PCC 7437]
MKVNYPKKLQNSLSARDILKQVISDREIHMITLNRYRFNEQHSCKDLTDVIEKLNGKPKELVRDLSHHVADEARHAVWLTDLLVELGADIGTPPGVSYIGEFERLLDQDSFQTEEQREDAIIAALTAINVTEKRGCEYFSAHINALKEAPQQRDSSKRGNLAESNAQTEENIKIRETLEKIFPEEAGHVRWGNRWLAQIAKQSPKHRQKVEQAKQKYAAIEQAAYESGMDIMAGAELRRLNHLLEITKTMPLWERPQYLIERLPETLLAPELQFTRIEAAKRAWQRDPQAFMEKFVPMFLNGFNSLQKQQKQATKA